MSWFAKLSTDELVAFLQKANWAYHNTSQSLLSDDEYDRGLDELKRRSPSHPFLSLVGAAPAAAKSVVILPVTMGSQDKVRDGEGGLERWMKRQTTKGYIVSEKLDGLSALIIVRGTKKSLYLRGDGVKGVDVSSACSHILQGITSDCIVRGELILRSADTPAGSIGRSLVNGWLHRGVSAKESITKIRFVAYQVLEPVGMARGAQLRWLAQKGLEVPWYQAWPAAVLVKSGFLKQTLIDRKSRSDYPLDGFVIGTDTVPVGLGGGEARNPPDSVAFKASLDDQKAETTVVAVEWNLSRQGLWIPRIQITPVEIGGATIQWLSGHNAKMIYENGLGPGASIVVRRSGDVIPTLDMVVQATEAHMPAEGTWEWDEGRVHARSREGGGSPVQGLLHAFQTLGVEGIGPGLVQKMVDGGFGTMRAVWDAKESGLAVCIGAGRAPTFMKSLRERRAAVGASTLLVASNLLPRGIAEKKLRAVFDKESDPRKWTMGLYPLEGWSEESFRELLAALPRILEWVDKSFGVVEVAKSEASVAKAPTKFVVFTGVRDKVLEGMLAPLGWGIEDSVTKKTTALVIADEGAKESGKMKKARDQGIQILTLSEFRKTLL